MNFFFSFHFDPLGGSSLHNWTDGLMSRVVERSLGVGREVVTLAPLTTLLSPATLASPLATSLQANTLYILI